MRPLAMMLVMMMMVGRAVAQEPIEPIEPAGPPVLQPQPQLQPQRWTYRIVDGPPVQVKRWGLFTAGVVMLSVGWCANLQAGIPTGEWRLDVPLLGPLLEIERLGSGGDPLVGFVDLMLVTDALVQMGGLALMIAGGTTYQKRSGQQRIELVPFGAGAAIRGSF